MGGARRGVKGDVEAVWGEWMGFQAAYCLRAIQGKGSLKMVRQHIRLFTSIFRLPDGWD